MQIKIEIGIGIGIAIEKPAVYRLSIVYVAAHGLKDDSTVYGLEEVDYDFDLKANLKLS